MAFLGSRELEIKRTTVPATVPSNNTAKCMYYFYCITKLIDLESTQINALQQYRDYQNYWRMTEVDKRKIVELCEILSPSRLKNEIIFEEPDLCGSFSNQFYKLSSTRLAVAAVENICIAGISSKVLQIMVYTNSWIQTFYYEALSGLKAELTPAVSYSSSSRRRSSSPCVII